jgi:hypothetical protein
LLPAEQLEVLCGLAVERGKALEIVEPLFLKPSALNLCRLETPTSRARTTAAQNAGTA